MSKKEKQPEKLLRIGIGTLLISCFLIISSCTHYDPTLYPGYDVLNPSAEVRLNPIEFTEDGNVIVNEAFMLWVYELKEEIKRLRKLVK